MLSYEAPRWFNSPKWKFTATALYDDTVDVTTFTSERLEGWVQAEQTLGKSTTLDYRFNYRRVQATNLPINLSLVPLLSQPVRVGGPDFIYIRDRRDNALESTKGSYNTVDAAVAAKYFGSQRSFSSILIQNSTYYAFGKNRRQDKKFVFARSLRIGVETPFRRHGSASAGAMPSIRNAPVHSAARVVPLGRRQLASRLSAESSRPARPRFRLSGRRWRALLEQPGDALSSTFPAFCARQCQPSRVS